MLSGRGATLRNQMNELTVEATTGLVANKTERLRGNYGPINGIETRIRQIDAFRTVSTEQQVVATVIQTALGTVTERASSLAANILAWVLSLLVAAGLVLLAFALFGVLMAAAA